MKALTLTQPWATLAAIGAKKNETRDKRSHYRGLVAIHAGAGTGKWTQRWLEHLCMQEPFRSALRSAGYEYWANLPRGEIVGIVDQRGCIESHLIAPTLSETELAFGDYSAGRFAYSWHGALLLAKSISATGALGFWSLFSDQEGKLMAAWKEARSGVANA